MNGPRLTEERLRHHLDSNQVMRERLCLAILPLLGAYTRERPRRPKGGPDGGRDIEAVYEGSVMVWGGVGFRNGGGNDDDARREAEAKFSSDLNRALTENPTLPGFVFFTNVDLTPGRIDHMKQLSTSKGLTVVDVFDIESLRHILDSPEGLIARLQYLEIPMSTTEQISLVNKFGTQLQNAVLARFDRVEQTLSEMERFLAFQKPLYRFDFYISLKENLCSKDIGNHAVLFKMEGLQDLGKTSFFLCVNQVSHKASAVLLVMQSHVWIGERKDKVTSLGPSIGLGGALMNSFCELSLTTGGHRVRIADLTSIHLTVYVTEGFEAIVNGIAVDTNGYELFNSPISAGKEFPEMDIPESVPFDGKSRKWITVVSNIERNLLFNPPNPSGRYLPLLRLTDG
jgi:hypothetical protein